MQRTTTPDKSRRYSDEQRERRKKDHAPNQT